MWAIWPGILFLSGSWSFLTPIFVPSYTAGVGLLILGCILNAYALRNSFIDQIDKKSYLAFIPLVISAIYVHFPYNIGMLILFIGLMVLVPCSRLRWAYRFGTGFILSGFILTIQSGMFPLFFRFAPQCRELNFMAKPVCYMLKILGLKCDSTQNTLFIQSAKEVFEFTTTFEKLGIYTWANLLLGVLAIILFLKARQKRRTLIFVLLVGLGYLVIRYMGIILLYLNFERMSVFWNPWLTVVSFAPLVAIFYKFISLEMKSVTDAFHLLSPSKENRKYFIITAFNVLIGMFFIIGSWGFQDPGIINKGRIIIDEKHSNWEWTTRKYDTQWFGIKSGYNYYCLGDYLGYFYQVDKNFKAITSDVLKNCDVLIIKIPTSAFSENEIITIREFVKNGGGVFLIGDHTNVFGSSTYINPIAQQFGLKFKYDSTHDLKTGDLSVYRPPTLLPHPVVQNLSALLFGTSCTIETSMSAEQVILGYGLKSLKLDYSQKNFFNKKKESTSMDFGQFLQSAGIKYGKGRVLAFTDSTVFSNYWIFVPGKPEILLGSINWLNRRNYLPCNINFILFIVGFLILIATIFYAQRRFNWVEGFSVMLFFTLLALPPTMVLFSSFNQYHFSPPQPRTKFTKVCFELEHSDFFLPILDLVRRPEISYHTFYVWTQRLGYIPVALPGLQDALKQGDLVIIINPVKHFTREERNQLLSYVDGGGKVILMDSSYNKKSTANEILQDFDMKLDFGPLKSAFFYDKEQRKMSTTQQAAKIEGGQPVLLTEDSNVILAMVRKGKGLIVVMADSMLFSDMKMGSTGTVPTPEQLKVYEMEFWMLKKLINVL